MKFKLLFLGIFAVISAVSGWASFSFFDQAHNQSSQIAATSETQKPNPGWQSFFSRFFSRRAREPRLGNLCVGDKNCNDFCKYNKGACDRYCKQNATNDLCRKPFSFELPKATSSSTTPPQQKAEPNQILKTQRPQQPTPEERAEYEKAGCQGKGVVQFSSPPMNVEDISFIIPIGQVSGSHITPTDHGYYHTYSWQPHRTDPSGYRDITAPADGVVTHIGLIMDQKNDYRLIIHHTCTFSTIYMHLKELSPKILQTTGEVLTHIYPHLSIQAGDVLGRASGFDFSVHNEEIVLKGFVVPKHYETEPWKIHTVDMFNHFVEPIKAQLLTKNVRQIEPRGGRIDYDVHGKLVGNWFVENTNGYAGIGKAEGKPYWSTHLAIAYNNLDPSLIMISIGSLTAQFAVKGNTPDPSSIGPESGLIKYELVDFEYITEDGTYWDRRSFTKIKQAIPLEQVHGVALVEMIGPQKIRFETFLEKKAEEVNDFTEKAVVYER